MLSPGHIAALWLLQHINLQVDFVYLMLSRILQGFGLGFLFVPVTAAAFVRLTPQQTGQGTGLFNLLRNEGGSVGIAISATVLSRHAQIHHARLVEHLTPLNPMFRERLAAIAHWLGTVSGYDSVTNQNLSLGLLHGEVLRQAGVLAYADVFWMLTLSFVVFLPFIVLLAGKPGHSGPMPH